ncbi:hypothetical protein BD414DRAFT_25683 [Trametes punicea]|nr:hypothetical protein BD414DRAFT_25683 [Trametes punicea]
MASATRCVHAVCRSTGPILRKPPRCSRPAICRLTSFTSCARGHIRKYDFVLVNQWINHRFHRFNHGTHRNVDGPPLFVVTSPCAAACKRSTVPPAVLTRSIAVSKTLKIRRSQDPSCPPDRVCMPKGTPVLTLHCAALRQRHDIMKHTPSMEARWKSLYPALSSCRHDTFPIEHPHTSVAESKFSHFARTHIKDSRYYTWSSAQLLRQVVRSCNSIQPSSLLL